MMTSKLGQAIHLHTQPVALVFSDHVPDGALQFQQGKWGCVISLLAAASKGRTAALCARTTACNGGRVGLGFCQFELGVIEHFLSTGTVGPKPGEFYKKDPQLARDYVASLPRVTTAEHLLFKPFSALEQDETPQAVVFLVNADQLSALVTMANYDQPTQDNVQVKFGAGCIQSVLYVLKDSQEGRTTCTIGLTDPSARKCIDKDLLSFSIPYARYLQMEDQVEESFLTKQTWQGLSQRI